MKGYKKYLILILSLIIIGACSYKVFANNSDKLKSDSKIVMNLLKTSVENDKQLETSDMQKIDNYMGQYRNNYYGRTDLEESERITIDEVWLAEQDYKAYFELNGYKFKDNQEKLKSKEFYKKEILKINDKYK